MRCQVSAGSGLSPCGGGYVVGMGWAGRWRAVRSRERADVRVELWCSKWAAMKGAMKGSAGTQNAAVCVREGRALAVGGACVMLADS